MDKIKILDMKGKEVEDISISWLEREKGDVAVHTAVTSYLSSTRSGTAHTKSRSEVKATGKKPYKQKGTGRARAGTVTSPIWRGGGIAFGPKNRVFNKKVNKKIRNLALQRSLTIQIDKDNVTVIDDIKIPEIKTKLANKFLKDLKIQDRVAIIISYQQDVENLNNIEYSFSNLPNCIVFDAQQVNSYDILLGKNIIITKDALNILENRIGVKKDA